MRSLSVPQCLLAWAALVGACAAFAPQQVAAQGRQSLRHGGLTRHYVVRAPQGITRSSAPLPVVFVLHGGGGNAANAEQMTGFTALVERERIIVVYPEGTAKRPRIPLLTWNAGHCCGHAMESRVDDVGFVNALIDRISATHPVDSSRIYVTGMSNGAMMSHRLGRELSHRIAAIAPVVGAVFGDETAPSQPVSALMINGLRDRAVPAEGGLSGGRGKEQWDGTPARPNLEQGAFWARANDCLTAPVRQQEGVVIRWRYTCPAGRSVELLQLTDNGHAWPGGQKGSRVGDTPSSALDATAVIWAFFREQRK